MSIVVYGKVLEPDGTAASGSVKINQQGVIVSANGIVVPGEILAALDGSGDFSQELETPIDGTVLTMFELPTGHTYGINLATGAATDLAELITSEGSAVAASDLQTLLQLAQQYTKTTVTSGPYTVLATDEYIYAPSGTFAANFPAATGSMRWLIVENGGAGLVTATANGSDTVGGAATFILYPGDRAAFVDVAAGKWSC